MRYPTTGKVEVLGIIDSNKIDGWKRRLKRRSALGQDVLVRPANGGLLLLIPDYAALQESQLRERGLQPCLVVETMPRKRDLWYRVRAEDGPEGVERLQDALIDLGYYPRAFKKEAPWGHLAGYKPNPKAVEGKLAELLVNRILLVSDAVVDLSKAALGRLRQTVQALRSKPRDWPPETGRKDQKGDGRTR